MPSSNVPSIVIRRLPLYLRSLTYMAERGQEVVSSRELGAWAGVSPAQVRKDLSHFGEFGKQGLGYNVSFLRDQIRSILQVDRDWNVVLVGAGALGHALANYWAFERWQYRIVAICDNDPAKVGQRLGSLRVLPVAEMKEVIEQENVKIAILAVPAGHAQGVAEQLVDCGVHAILNYAPINLVLPSWVRVANIDPVTNLQSLTYYL